MPAGGSSSFVSPPPSDIVSERENQELIKAISKEKVQRAIWSLAEDRAPGLDGFPPIFFKHY